MESSRTRRSLDSFMLAPPAAFGVIGGVVFGWWSLTPTLLPRDWMIQAAISALSMAVGYGVGSAIGAGVRWIAEHFKWSRWGDRYERLVRIVAIAVAVIIAVGGGALWFV